MSEVTATVVSQHEPERPMFEEAWIVDSETAWGRDQNPDLYFTRATAERRASQLCDGPYRILRLPSKREAARAPFVDAVNKAACELAEQGCVWPFDTKAFTNRLDAYLSAKSALASFDSTENTQ